MPTKKTLWLAIPTALLLLAAAIAVAGTGAAGNSTSSSNAANKAKAAGASVEVLEPDASDTDEGQLILSTSIKTSNTQDLLFHVSLECALWTEVKATTIADHALGLTPYGRAEAHIVVWLEVDGVAVKVSSDDPDGKIVFCERVEELEIQDMDDSTGNFTIRQYEQTRQANAFNWWKLDLGSGTHTVNVYADIDSYNTEGSMAKGAIGKRTLLVDPAHFA